MRENVIRKIWYHCTSCGFDWKSEFNIYEECPLCKSKNLKRGELKQDGTDK